jgi:hypothetical protein
MTTQQLRNGDIPNPQERGVPLRLGPETVEEARQEVQAIEEYFEARE